VHQAVQLWLPLFEVSVFNDEFRRDLQRAQNAWQGEQFVWLLPDIKEVRRWSWKFDGWHYRELAVPSETLNRIHVVHVTKEGYCFPPYGQGLPDSWNGVIPPELFRLWLNTALPSLIPGRKELKLLRPVFDSDRVKYEERTLEIPPGPVLPIVSFDEKTRRATCKWPPGDGFPPPVSPEAESIKAMGPFTWERDATLAGCPIALDRSGKMAINVRLRWQQPFNEMFPFGGGPDLMYQHALMRRCVEGVSQGEPAAAREIAARVSEFTARGWTTLELSYVAPTLAVLGEEELLWDIEYRFGIEAQDISQLVEHEDYPKRFQQEVPILRVFGWLGYMWQELNETVNVKGKHIRVCERCGYVIKGTKKKQFCGPDDNIVCYRERRAGDQRRSRQRRSLLKNSPT